MTISTGPTAPTAIVTGGSTGIGASICQHLLDTGYQVINLARRDLNIDNPQLKNLHVDLADREATQAIAKQIAKNYQVTTLIHNAGVIKPNLIEDVDLNDLDYLANIHLGAAIALTQACLPAMKKEKFGRILLITSRAALGLQTRTNYTATKCGMIGMARTWALELGAYGITVNTVAPGPIASTEMFHEVIPEDSPKIHAIAESIPVKHLGQPEDVARAVMFFVAPENYFITGQTLMVCGGSSLGGLQL